MAQIIVGRPAIHTYCVFFNLKTTCSFVNDAWLRASGLDIRSHVVIRLSLSAESASHSTVFFSHNKSANSTFSHGLSSKQTERLFCVASVLHT